MYNFPPIIFRRDVQVVFEESQFLVLLQQVTMKQTFIGYSE